MELLKEGLILMCTGMGTVFMFLVILIFVMFGMEKAMVIINKFLPEQVEEVATTKKTSNGNKNQEIAIAIAAIKALR